MQSRTLPNLFAGLEEDKREDDNKQPDQTGQREEDVIHVYPVEGGGVLFTQTPLEDEETKQTIVDSKQPEANTRSTRREPPYFLHVLLLLLIFIGLDNIGTVFAQFSPVVTVTITPQVKSITTTATIAVGEGAAVHGRVLAPLTLSQTQTVNVTGKGHQNAQQATGQLIFFNGSFNATAIDAGTVYTGADGVQVVTDQRVPYPPIAHPQTDRQPFPPMLF